MLTNDDFDDDYKNLRESDYLSDPAADGRIILR